MVDRYSYNVTPLCSDVRLHANTRIREHTGLKKRGKKRPKEQ